MSRIPGGYRPGRQRGDVPVEQSRQAPRMLDDLISNSREGLSNADFALATQMAASAISGVNPGDGVFDSFAARSLEDAEARRQAAEEEAASKKFWPHFEAENVAVHRISGVGKPGDVLAWPHVLLDYGRETPDLLRAGDVFMFVMVDITLNGRSRIAKYQVAIYLGYKLWHLLSGPHLVGQEDVIERQLAQMLLLTDETRVDVCCIEGITMLMSAIKHATSPEEAAEFQSALQHYQHCWGNTVAGNNPLYTHTLVQGLASTTEDVRIALANYVFAVGGLSRFCNWLASRPLETRVQTLSWLSQRIHAKDELIEDLAGELRSQIVTLESRIVNSERESRRLSQRLQRSTDELEEAREEIDNLRAQLANMTATPTQPRPPIYGHRPDGRGQRAIQVRDSTNEPNDSGRE